MGNNIYKFCNCVEHQETESDNKNLNKLTQKNELPSNNLYEERLLSFFDPITSKTTPISNTERNDQLANFSVNQIITYLNEDESDGELSDNNQKGQSSPNGVQDEGILSNDLFKCQSDQFLQDKNCIRTEEDRVLQLSFEGELKGNNKNGFGKEIMVDGSVYTGHYLNGKKHGQGRLRLPNGAEFQGEFNLDKIEGKGIFTWSCDNKIYNGEWKNNSLEGFGTLIQGNKAFVGYFSHDVRNGLGLNYFFNSHNTILGIWKDDQLNGITIFLSETKSNRIWKMEKNKKKKEIIDLGELTTNDIDNAQYKSVIDFYYFVKGNSELKTNKMKMDYVL